MLDGWYNDENNKPAFDKNINSQADMDKAGISGTFLGQSAIGFDGNGTQVSLNADGSRTEAAMLNEVTVSAERASNNTV